jgi:NAD(P)-dependent dehydrogenase (short-subunit alcohol dehydrogenase family)
MSRRVAVVTGAGSGIGREVTHALLADGWAVALAGRRADTLDATLAGSPAGGDATLVVPADVADDAAVDALFAATVERFGRVDLLFNNAGSFGSPAPFEDYAREDWRALVDTNLSGAFYCAQAAYRAMKAQDPRGGRIVTGLTRQIALEGRAHDIACGQIDVGNAATEMTAAMERGVIQADGSIAAEATMDAANVARAVVYMAGLPLDANVLFMTVMANRMPFVGRG